MSRFDMSMVLYIDISKNSNISKKTLCMTLWIDYVLKIFHTKPKILKNTLIFNKKIWKKILNLLYSWFYYFW